MLVSGVFETPIDTTACSHFLAPRDFFLFPELTSALKIMRLVTVEEVKAKPTDLKKIF